MQLNSKQLTRYYFEYALWRKIDEHNQEAISNDDKSQIIHTTLARSLRRKIGDMDKITTIGQLRQAVNNVFDKQHLDLSTADMQKYYTAFTNMTNFTARDQAGLKNTGVANINGILPLSPYDPNFATLGVILDGGSRLSGINAKNYNDVSNLEDFRKASDVQVIGNVHYDEDHDRFTGYNTNLPLFNVSDASGMSQLRLYMTDDEYQKTANYVNSAVDLPHMSDDELKTRREMTRKAVYILRGLQQEGYTYTISPDSRLGQIQAKVDNTKLTIRLTDSPNNREYIGRVYDDGVSGTYNSTMRDPDTGTYKANTTPQQALDLVNAALGNNVKIRGNNGQESKFNAGQALILQRMVSGRNRKYYATYHSNGNLTMVSGPYLDKNGKPDRFHNAVRMIFNTKYRSMRQTNFKDGQDAESYLRDSVESARTNYKDRINVDGLIAAAKKRQDDPDYVPEFDDDSRISITQQAIWDELTQPDTDDGVPTMIRPGFTNKDINDFMRQHQDDDYKVVMAGLERYSYPSDMSREEMVRQYVNDMTDYDIGNFDQHVSRGDFDPIEAGSRFNPAMVIANQTSANGVFRNRDDMIAALKKANIDPDELKGNPEALSSLKDEMITYDPDSAVKMKDLKSPFMQSMYKTIKDSLVNNGVLFNEDDIKIDKNGIVEYKGEMSENEFQYNKNGDKFALKPVQGHIGQIFEPDKDGILYTNFNGGDNYAVIPGYRAEILPQKDGEDKSLEERTVLSGYKQDMIKNIKYQMRKDITMGYYADGAEDATGLNSTYKEIYGEHRDPDFISQYKKQGMPDHILKAMIESEGQKVRYSNKVRDGSTVNAEYRADTFGFDIANDNSNDAYNLTGNRNMSVLSEESNGYFDPIASNATTINQGITKFLASGAKVDDDGHIIPGPKTGPGSRMSLMNIPEAQYMKYDPFDRQNMTISNWLQAQTVTKDVNVAQMTFGGWNQDDGVVIGKKFAENYKVYDSVTNEMRPLQVGDKISDMNGNKGVISLVVDPDMNPEEAKKQGLEKEVAWFKANPDMDVVQAPFSQVSRYNGGTTRQLMRDPQDLINPETGEAIKAAMGKMPMIVTDKTVDVKSKLYTQDDLRNGKGRKVSAQLAWTLDAKDATAIMKEVYGRNDSALSNLHEYLNVLGMDIDPYGNLSDQMSDQAKNERYTIKSPELVYGTSGRLSMKQTEAGFDKELNHRGGMMELPFDIKLANGEKTNKVPVLSSYLRSGSELVDGTAVVHDYTHQYETLFRAGIRYRDSQKTIAELTQKPSLDAKDKRKLLRNQDKITEMQKKAQEAYDAISSDVVSREFEGKHNIFKDKIMAHRMPHSATMVWSEDPRLPLDTIGVSQDFADEMNLKDGDSAMFWRDPSLRDGSARYMKVKIMDNLVHSISSNPLDDKSFDGDYDGDTIGCAKLETPAAKFEAKQKFSVRANLLDYGAGRDEKGNYPLYFQHSLDVLVEEHDRPELKKKWDQITDEVNKFEQDFKDGKLNQAQVDSKRVHTLQELNDYAKDVYSRCGNAHIRYDTVENHLKSVKEACLDTGAKGNNQKFIDYAKWLGVSGVKVDSKGNLSINNVEDLGDTGATYKMQQETMKATAIKSFGTGVAGAYSQRGIKALRNVCPKAITELTYPVTQSVLQIKHNPEQAVKTYSIMMGPLRKLWQGQSLARDSKDGSWHVNCDKDGKPLQATPEEWKKNFELMFNQDLGVSPNPEYIDEVAKAMGKNGKMQSIEDLDTQSAMDTLAYSSQGGLDNLLELGKQHANLFKGKYNASFAPNKLRDNVKQKHLELDGQKETEAAVKNGTAIPLGGGKVHVHKDPKQFGKSDVKLDAPSYNPSQHDSGKVIRVNADIVPNDEPVDEQTGALSSNGLDDIYAKADELENKAKSNEESQELS